MIEKFKVLILIVKPMEQEQKKKRNAHGWVVAAIVKVLNTGG
jgi:hypothetical protein